jgi:hypothetical protein
MSQYDIDTSFFDLVVSFGDKPRNSDAGHGGLNVKQKEDGVCGIVLPNSAKLSFIFRANFLRYALSLHLCRR